MGARSLLGMIGGSRGAGAERVGQQRKKSQWRAPWLSWLMLWAAEVSSRCGLSGICEDQRHTVPLNWGMTFIHGLLSPIG